MRNESDSVLEAIDEALRIGREAHVPVEIWHIKVAGKNNWGRMPEVVAKINAARAGGADVTADTYAYTAWFNDFSAFIPPWAHDGGATKLVERLKDPATRAAHPQRHAHAFQRLGQRMAGDSRPRGRDDWRGRRIPRCYRCRASGFRRLRNSGIKIPWTRSSIFSSKIRTQRRRLRHVAARRDAGVAAAMGRDRQRFCRNFARGHSGPGASSSPRLRNFPAHPAKVCPRR